MTTLAKMSKLMTCQIAVEQENMSSGNEHTDPFPQANVSQAHPGICM